MAQAQATEAEVEAALGPPIETHAERGRASRVHESMCDRMLLAENHWPKGQCARWV
jgi:hypothetical protein